MADNQVPFDQLKVPANKYGTDGASLPQYQRDFIERFAPYAMLAAAQSGLPARFLLAEASIETDWGRSGSATRGNNMFGIKATPGQIAAGVPVEYLPTTEYRKDGTRYTENSPFIKYKTAEDGFNGFVDKLQRTRWPDQKALLNYRSATPYAQDDATEKALSDAFGRTSYLTMPGINQTMIDRMARFPADLQKVGYKTAVDFSKASNDLAGLVAYNDGAGYPDVSAAADNDGLGTFSLNGVTFNRTPAEQGPLDVLSDSITRGLETAGRGAADLFSGGADAIGRGLNGLFGGGTADAANYPPLALPAEGTDGFGNPVYGGPGDALGYGNGVFGQGVTPFGNVNPLAFAGGRDFSGGVGPGSLNPSLTPYGAPPDAYAFAGGFNPSQGVGPGIAGELPPGFDAAAYLAQNRDVAASGMDAATHWRNFGAAEGRALAPPGWTQTQGAPAGTSTFGPSGTPTIGSGSTASTIGAPAASGTLPPFFSPVDYLAANGDLQALGFTPERAAQHFQEFGRHEVRALAPWLQASVYDAPGATATQGPGGLSPTYPPPQPTQTLGPDGSVNVMSSGLVPTLTPPDLTSTIGPGPTITARTGTFNADEYLRANADVAASGQSALDHFRNYGAREGRAIDTLGNHFNGDAYLAQNRDVALAGLNPLEHFLRYGAQEARTLAPTDWASPLTATTDVGTYGAPAATQTLGPSGFTPTIDAPPLTSTIGPPSLSGTYGPPAATSTLAPPMAMPSYSPGGGINNPFGFSNANVGSGLGATSQSFSSFYPLDTNIGYSSGGSSGGGGAISDPFAFSGADVSGFDVNAAPPADSGGQGGGGGGGGGTAKGSSSSAAFLADQARTRAYWESLVKPADLYGNTNTHTTPVVGAPVVPNLTVSNLALGAPGAMFSMFAPWR